MELRTGDFIDGNGEILPFEALLDKIFLLVFAKPPRKENVE
jgi:hypothetical protein